MSQQRDVHEDLTAILAKNGRPVTDEGKARARKRLRDAEARRDPAARAALIERLRAQAA